MTDLHLTFVYDDQARWVKADNGNTIFVYGAWGDNRGTEREDRLRYDETIRSSGWRLRIEKEVLTAFLNQKGLDMIVEIEITRRNKGYGYYQKYDDKEEYKETRFDRVIILRKDGTIEAAEGRLGTWSAPSS